jgi:hypothetical protein
MAAFVAARTGTVVAGTSGRARVRVENNGDQAVKSPAELTLFLSADTTLDDADVLLGKVARSLKLRPHQGKTVATKVTYPLGEAGGSYYLLADVEPSAVGSPPDSNPANNAAASSQPLQIEPAQIDLFGSDSGVGGALTHAPQSVPAGGAIAVSLHVANTGNAVAEGDLTYTISAKRVDAPESDPALTLVTVTRHLRLRPDGHTRLPSRLILPSSLTPGSYVLTASLDTTNVFTETNETNNTLTAKLPLNVI